MVNTQTLNTQTLYVVQSGFTLLKSFADEESALDYADSLDPVNYNGSDQYVYVSTYQPGELERDDVTDGYFA